MKKRKNEKIGSREKAEILTVLDLVYGISDEVASVAFDTANDFAREGNLEQGAQSYQNYCKERGVNAGVSMAMNLLLHARLHGTPRRVVIEHVKRLVGEEVLVSPAKTTAEALASADRTRKSGRRVGLLVFLAELEKWDLHSLPQTTPNN